MANSVTIRIKTFFDGKGVKQAKKSTVDLATTLKGLATGLIVREIFNFGKESLNLAREQAAAEAQVASTIASTGQAAGATLSQLKAHAAALQGVTNFGDEATLQGQALLLTFTNIKENFPQATETMLDMSAALGQDLKSSALQLGKALNDPIAGVSALQRVGVSFSDEQKRVIKSLSETGRMAEAQRLILKELNREFGGSAAAAREADGGFTALGNSFGDLREEIGFVLAELNKASGATGAVSDFFSEVGAGIRELRVALGGGDLGDEIAVTQKRIEDLIAFRDKIAQGPNILNRILGQEDKFSKERLAELDDTIAGERRKLAEMEGQERAAISEQSGEAVIVVEEENAVDLLSIKEALARDVFDIQRESDDELRRAAIDLADDKEEIEASHNDRMDSIRERAAKDRLKSEANLQKNIDRSDANLRKSLRKSFLSEAKKIEKFRQSSDKEKNRQRKLDNISALEDQRLFDFRLRELAADGQGIRIKQLLEERSIREEIDRERGKVEREIEIEKKDDQIATIRDEGQERRAQLKQDAIERAALLEERNNEELAGITLRLAKEVQGERENFAKRKSDLTQFHEDRATEIQQRETESIAELARGLTGIEDLTQTHFSELIGLAEKIGPDIGEALAKGIEAGVADNLRLDELLGGGNVGQNTSSDSRLFLPIIQKQAPGFKHGGSFTVGGSGGPDSQLVSFRATPGEPVTVGGGGGGRSATVSINVAGSINGIDEINAMFQSFADQIAEAMA